MVLRGKKIKEEKVIPPPRNKLGMGKWSHGIYKMQEGALSRQLIGKNDLLFPKVHNMHVSHQHATRESYMDFFHTWAFLWGEDFIDGSHHPPCGWMTIEC